jgi:hypothetical protein
VFWAPTLALNEELALLTEEEEEEEVEDDDDDEDADDDDDDDGAVEAFSIGAKIKSIKKSSSNRGSEQEPSNWFFVRRSTPQGTYPV